MFFEFGPKVFWILTKLRGNLCPTVLQMLHRSFVMQYENFSILYEMCVGLSQMFAEFSNELCVDFESLPDLV